MFCWKYCLSTSNIRHDRSLWHSTDHCRCIHVHVHYRPPSHITCTTTCQEEATLQYIPSVDSLSLSRLKLVMSSTPSSSSTDFLLRPNCFEMLLEMLAILIRDFFLVKDVPGSGVAHVGVPVRTGVSISIVILGGPESKSSICISFSGWLDKSASLLSDGSFSGFSALFS